MCPALILDLFPGSSAIKNLSAVWETWVRSWVIQIPWMRAWQPASVFLLGEFHGQRSLAGCSPWGPKGREQLSD